uniref:CARD domain-containing protein n=1 Tax=Ciona savignyi TaxID=51511 RepID=H2ZDE0_CIOSA
MNDIQLDKEYELQKEVLNRQRHYLCENLQPDKLFPWLQSRNALTTDDCEQMQSLATTKRKVDKLIDILIKSGPGCLIKLYNAIIKSSSTQIFIAERLKKKYEEQIYMEIDRRSPPPAYTTYQCQPRMESRQYPDSARSNFEWMNNSTRKVTGTTLPPSLEVTSTDMVSGKPLPYSPSERSPVTGEWPSKFSSNLPSANYEEIIRDRVSIFVDGNSPQNTRHFSSQNHAEERDENVLPEHISLQDEKLRYYSSPNHNVKAFTSQMSQVMSQAVDEQSVEIEKLQANLRISSNRGSFTRLSRGPDEHDVTDSYNRSPTNTLTSHQFGGTTYNPSVAQPQVTSNITPQIHSAPTDTSPMLKITIPLNKQDSTTYISPTSDSNYLMLQYPNSDSESFEITDDDD